MFNLLVSGAGWAQNFGSMPLSRLFEHTEKRLIEFYNPSGEPDFGALRSLPCLFMDESRRNGTEVAHIGTINSISVIGKEISLEYSYDTSIPPLTNAQISTFSNQLDVNEWEFNRTHWAIKDRDLFKALIRNLQPRRLRPTVFQISDPEQVEPSLMSAMMPFDASFSSVYAAIQSAAGSKRMHCRRADDIWENPAVIQDVVSLIDRSKVVVCDCSDRNPNVFYEVGIAHTLGREVILITQSEHDIPFDLRHLRYIKYLNNIEGREELTKKIISRLDYLG